ncbi:MAG TPA: TIGR03936 family radical SAM-associated protein [Anaerolineales bacterium]
MTADGPFRYRIRFAKSAPLRFIGHLDLHRTWERTLRRAGAPLAYSEGYNPRPRLNLGLALPLGCTSQGDLLDVMLEASWESEDLSRALQQAAPPGLIVEAVWPVPAGTPPLQREVSACEYQVELVADADVPHLQSAIQRLLRSDSLPRERRGKSYDLRPLVEGLMLETRERAERPRLVMQLAAREGATGRPEEVLLELGLDPLAHVPHRARVLGPTVEPG